MTIPLCTSRGICCAALIWFIATQVLNAVDRPNDEELAARSAAKSETLLRARDEAWQLYREGRTTEAEQKLVSIGLTGDAELDKANELARMAFEAKGNNEYQLARDLARRALTYLTDTKVRAVRTNETRSQYFELIAALHERVLGDKVEAERFYDLAEVADRGNERARAARRRIRDTAAIAQRRGEAVEREKQELAKLQASKK